MNTFAPFRFLQRARQLPLLVGALFAVGCQGAQTHELGFTQTSQDLSAGETSTPFFTSYDDFVGHWVGEADAALPLALDAQGSAPAYQFPSGSPRFVLDLQRVTTATGSRLVAGTLTFGEGTPPPPASDPELGYPVGVNYAALLSYGGRDPGLPSNIDQRLPPFEAFPYSVETSTEVADPDVPLGELSFPGPADGVLPLRFTTTEILDGWCQLQVPAQNHYDVYTPFPADGGAFESRGDGTNALCNVYVDTASNCPPPREGVAEDVVGCLDPDPPVLAQLSCDKTFLAPYCECTRESCRASGVLYGGELSSSLLVRRVGERLIGAFQNEIFLNARNLTVPMGQVRFERVPD